MTVKRKRHQKGKIENDAKMGKTTLKAKQTNLSSNFSSASKFQAPQSYGTLIF